MSNELEVIVNQTPAVIDWNFEQIKTQLAEIMSTYEGLTYTEDSLKTAKADVADLRKLRNEVEDRRKAIKESCMEPYKIIEAQAKELTSLIDKPIEEISKQIKAYEDEQKAEKKKEIIAFMEETFKDLPEEIAKRLIEKSYTPQWENKSTTKKTWQEAIKASLELTLEDLDKLNEVDEDFKESAIEQYKKDLTLGNALMKVNELQQQREMLREKERQRQEAEEKEREHQEAEVAEQPSEVAENHDNDIPDTPEKNDYSSGGEVTHIAATFSQALPPRKEPEKEQLQEPKQSGLVSGTIKVTGTREQIRKILGYIKHIEATYEVIK